MISAAIIATLLITCPLQVHSGDRLRLTVFYAHESSDGVYYKTSRVMDPVLEDGVAQVTAEDGPVGARWMVNGFEVKRCGVEYVFADGFETGNDNRWD